MSEEARIYRIETVADFDMISDDRIEDCLADFASYIAIRRLAATLIDADVARVTDTFVWKDDGISGPSAVSFVDDAGEVIFSLDLDEGKERP